jgi:anti-sigma factor RsiW
MSMDSKQPPSSPQVRALGGHFETALDRAARAAEPPDYDQLAAYVDGALDDVDREIVESWLERDPDLRAEVDDLRALRDAMSQPGVAPASASFAAPASTSGPSRDALTASRGAAGAASIPGTTSAARPSSGVVSFEEASKRAGAGKRRRFGTATVVMGAMAAAVIGAVTWMAVRTARVGDSRPGASGSQVARQPEQPRQGPPEQAPPVQAPNAAAPQIAVRDAGGLIAIDAAGIVTGLTADAADPAMTRLVADALTKGTLPPGAAAAAGLGARELTLMSRSRQTPVSRLAPLSPIATIVRTTRPVFRWSPHPGARGYVVTIYGPDFDQVMSSPTLTDTTWTAAALKQGITYQWQVTADTSEGPVRAPAPPAPDARFRVIDAAAGKTLERDLARAGSSKLLKGLLLAQAGVLDEAEQTFEGLQTENPDSKRVADLLARVRERRLEP